MAPIVSNIDVRSTAADPLKKSIDYFVVYPLMSNILGHGSKLVATNLLRFDLCLGRNPGLARGPGNGLEAKALATARVPSRWPGKELGHGPKPQSHSSSFQALGHGPTC